MPLHGYTTDRRPPTNADHLLAHPYSILISGYQVAAGSATMASTLWSLKLSLSLQRLPEPLLVVVGALLVVGGLCVIRGLLDDHDNLMVGWRTERTGLILSATAWGAYGLTMLAAFPGSVLAWSFALVIATAHLIRLRATQLEERRVRARIEEERLRAGGAQTDTTP